ncbi:MAG: hypothetical protein AB7S54_07985 [Bacteroidales bacterium]
MKLKSILLLVLITTLCSGMMCECEDETNEPQLPPETITGANTFGCLVNGEVWRNGGIPFPYSSIDFNELNDSIVSIGAIRGTTDATSYIHIYIRKKGLSIGKYQCDSSLIFIRFSRSFSKSVNPTACDYPISRKGFIEFTRFDLQNRIVSGRFEAHLYSSECDSLIITKGRFDLLK